jgi:hypothetical protein
MDGHGDQVGPRRSIHPGLIGNNLTEMEMKLRLRDIYLP